MKLEQQVTSRELSQKLKDLGVKQESLFYWHFTEYEDALVLFGDEHTSIVEEGKRHEFVGYVSAFTVAELGEMLPLMLDVDGFIVSWESTKKLNSWSVYLENGNYKKMSPEFKADTEAEARGLMLVYLLENKLITL